MNLSNSRSPRLRRWMSTVVGFLVGRRPAPRRQDAPRPAPPFRLPRSPEQKLLVIAHRGYSGRYPENTMLAFSKAIEARADVLELDVTLSRDGRIVVFHDDTLERTTDGSGEIRERSWHEIANLEAGAWFSREHAGEPIPSLEEVLDLVKDRVALNIEIKPEAVTDDEVNGIEARCVRAVRDRGLTSQVFFSSFHPAAVERLSRLAPEISGALLVHRPTGAHVVEDAQERGARLLHTSLEGLDAETVDAAHDAGLPVFVYTLNDADEYARALELNVDGVFTDYPEKLQSFLAKRVRQQHDLSPQPIGLGLEGA